MNKILKRAKQDPQFRAKLISKLGSMKLIQVDPGLTINIADVSKIKPFIILVKGRVIVNGFLGFPFQTRLTVGRSRGEVIFFERPTTLEGAILQQALSDNVYDIHEFFLSFF